MKRQSRLQPLTTAEQVIKNIVVQSATYNQIKILLLDTAQSLKDAEIPTYIDAASKILGNFASVPFLIRQGKKFDSGLQYAFENGGYYDPLELYYRVLHNIKYPNMSMAHAELSKIYGGEMMLPFEQQLRNHNEDFKFQSITDRINQLVNLSYTRGLFYTSMLLTNGKPHSRNTFYATSGDSVIYVTASAVHDVDSLVTVSPYIHKQWIMYPYKFILTKKYPTLLEVLNTKELNMNLLAVNLLQLLREYCAEKRSMVDFKPDNIVSVDNVYNVKLLVFEQRTYDSDFSTVNNYDIMVITLLYGLYTEQNWKSFQLRQEIYAHLKWTRDSLRRLAKQIKVEDEDFLNEFGKLPPHLASTEIYTVTQPYEPDDVIEMLPAHLKTPSFQQVLPPHLK